MGAAKSSLGWLVSGTLRCGSPGWLWDWAQVVGGLGVLHFRSWVAILKAGGGIGPVLAGLSDAHALIWELQLSCEMETKLDKKTGRDDAVSSALPHVDTGAPGSAWPGFFGYLFRRGNKKGGQVMDMAAASGPIAREIVLVGGGHSHVFAIKKFGMNPEPGVRITLITQHVLTPYSGMLPGHIAGQYTKEECHIDLGRLCRFGKARLVVANVCKIDRENKLVHVEGSDRPPIRYDVLSLDVGSSPVMVAEVKGNIEPTPVKPISNFSSKWDDLLKAIETTDQANITVGVVGAGAGGVELCLSMQARIESLTKTSTSTRVKFVLISRSKSVCPSHNKAVQRKFARILKERGVEVVLDFEAVAVHDGQLIAKDGRVVDLDECVWCASAKTQDWLGESGLNVNPGGFVRVNETLESENTHNVFAAGDCADVVAHPRPKAGVFAVRQGPPLAENLRRAVQNLNTSKGKALLRFKPQSNFLGIIGTGTPLCIASRGSMALEGEWLYKLKDWIDRKWMAGYSSQLPVALPSQDENDNRGGLGTVEELELAAKMRCGGCGAKVGKTVLDNVMANLNPPTRSEVVIGLDAPDDCAVVAFDKTSTTQVVQTVDFFRSFIDDPYVFGQVAANHALSDCHAMCAEPISAMAIAVVPFASSGVIQGDLEQMMAGVSEVLRECNCALVGGHSCEGSELALGLSVSGKTTRGSRLLTKGGVQEGDALVLTKPIGTGVIFAADMRVLAQGAWVASALESMIKSNQQPALRAREHGATACTDVTGFGLLGHLSEMIQASEPGLVVELDLERIPYLPGAVACVEAGVFSSLQPENRRLKHAIVNLADVAQHKAFPLLFDPQTSGGLLVSLPKAQAKAYVKAVPGAAIIGHVKAQQDGQVGTVKILT
mmetsp:Transcript_19625/g.34920  ORF Transcript_19625/g.34920 Transcript_19625/m.34920 type:complete len:889 (+) Transcript_19625:17-2683(+)